MDYLLVLDGDVIFANRSRTIEEVIQSGIAATARAGAAGEAHITLHERMHNKEVDAACILVKRSPFSFAFIDEWLGFAPCLCSNVGVRFNNFDNGALLVLLLHRLYPDHPRTASCIGRYEAAKEIYGYKTFQR